MKHVLAILIALAVAGPVFAADKAPAKKEVKKHKKFEGSKVADAKPTAPAKKK